MCPEVFKNARLLLNHLKLEHKGKGIHSCYHCDAIFTSNKALTKHLVSSHKKKQKVENERKLFKCDICKMNFDEKDELIEHKSSVHNFDVFQPAKNLAIFVSKADENEEYYGKQDEEVEIIRCELQGDLIVFYREKHFVKSTYLLIALISRNFYDKS